MTAIASNLINELKTIGYALYLDGEHLKYRYTAITEPPKERAILLLDTLKRNKGEVTEYLTFKDKPDTLKSLFMDTVRHIERVYSPAIWDTGVMETTEYQKAMDKVDRTWLDCMSGKSGIEDFKSVLAEWERIIKSWQN